MADAIVGVLIENVISLIKSEVGLFMGIDDDMQKLSSILSTIQAVLQDAEIEKTINKQIANWLAKLKDAAYEASDILEEWSIYAQQPTSNKDQVGTSDFSCLSLNRCTSRQSIARKTKKVINKLDKIAQERSKFHLTTNPAPTGTRMELVESRETSSFLEVDVVYGRDADREKIIEVLLNNVSREEDVSVYSVVGLGGLGKTTLAKLVYNDEKIVAHFEKRAWVCVSEDFEVKKLAAMILESLTTQACKTEGLDTIQRQVKEQLSGKKFFLVLDDVWNEDQDKWDKLKSTLRSGAKGSSILVTTRLEKVSSIMSTLAPHQLKFLADEYCWSLFKKCAFGVGREETAELVEIGKQIVQKCGGVPLAIKTLGRLMGSKKKAAEWMQVRDSKIWTLPQDKGTDILPALRLSYNHLPSNLKQCFAFCAIYPKDYEIHKEELIRLWMANGFLQSDGNMELEDCGNLNFDGLLHRSFFQEIKIDDFGDIESCKMHDLIHDLACFVSLNECGIVEVGSKTLPKGIRHCSLVLDLRIERGGRHFNLETRFKSYPVLRTFLFRSQYHIFIEVIFESLNCCLHALDLSETNTKVLPASIGKMKHLRYLNMSSTSITLLPESICNLRNLQCLKLQWCSELEELPKEMSKMKGLRHLDVRGCEGLEEMPIGMGQLTQLRTLSLFVVGMESGRSIAELGGMNLLGGVIEIRGLEKVRSLEEAQEANLMSKQNISLLNLCWSAGDFDNVAVAAADVELHEKVLEEGLQPHLSSLKALSIDGYRGRMLPSWINQLQKLVMIKLSNCHNCECLPPLWERPLLKDLTISGIKSVKCIIGDDVNNRAVSGPCFSKLERLSLQCMENLEEWSSLSLSEDVLLFPCLEKLKIKECPKLEGLPPCLPRLQILHLENGNEMMLRRSLENPIPLLNTLEIEGFNEMTCLPQGIFQNCSTSLATLTIGWCKMLKSVGAEIQSLTALKELAIHDCSELDSLSELEGILFKLTSLKELDIMGCPSLKCLPVLGGIQGQEEGFQNSLTTLAITSCTNLTSVSKGLRYLTLLETLFIQHCPELELNSREVEEDLQRLISLRDLCLGVLPQLTALPEWIQHLPRLQSLDIMGCENLTRVPDWLQRITTLQSLQIKTRNRELHRRCKKDKGEDWHIISRIPDLDIRDPEEEAASTSGAGCSSVLLNKFRRNTCLNYNN